MCEAIQIGIEIKAFRNEICCSIANPAKDFVMNSKHLILSLIIPLILCSCSKDPQKPNLDTETQTLVDILLDEMEPLSNDPLSWDDQDLRWLDPLADKSVVGLGEATHGTAEFFDAKHRIFRFLVENHDYKIFAFEADFGESLFIEEAVQQGNAAAIESLMKTKMHFWTWKTKEVKDLLEWMCIYNQDKADKDKVHYMGVDCQFNTYHPTMVRQYLTNSNAPFLSFADSILMVAETESVKDFDSYNAASFNDYLVKIEALQDSLIAHKDDLETASSDKEFQLHARIMELVRQVSVVRYKTGSTQSQMDSRDMYMAQNTSWLLDYFEDEKVVVWAHNYHISDHEGGNIGTMGSYLRYALWDQYATVGFLFSRGTFTAVGMEGGTYTEPGDQILDSIPKAGSLNALMSHTGEAAFAIEIGALANYVAWYNAFENYMEYFFMGSGYNNRPGDYYVNFDPDLYHYLIYFDQSTASVLLE